MGKSTKGKRDTCFDFQDQNRVLREFWTGNDWREVHAENGARRIYHHDVGVVGRKSETRKVRKRTES